MYNSLTVTEKLSYNKQPVWVFEREALTLLSLMTLIVLNEIQSFFLRNHINAANSVPVCNSIYLVCNFHKLWTECRGYKLSVSHVSKAADHIFLKELRSPAHQTN